MIRSLVKTQSDNRLVRSLTGAGSVIVPPPVCGVNYGNLGGPATGYQGDPNPSSFDPYWSENGLVYLGKSPSDPGATYTALLRTGPVVAAIGANLTAIITWDTDAAYEYQAYSAFTFRIYGVKDPRAAQVGVGNLPTAQVLTTAYVEVNTQTWTGNSTSTYWAPQAQVIDVSPITTEIFADPCWPSGNYLQFILVPVSFPYAGGIGYVTFGGQGQGNELTFSLGI